MHQREGERITTNWVAADYKKKFINFNLAQKAYLKNVSNIKIYLCMPIYLHYNDIFLYICMHIKLIVFCSTA